MCTPVNEEPAFESGDVDSRMVEFARVELGPASEKRLADPAVRAAVRERLKRGLSLADAVVGEMHACLNSDRRVADEFVAYFLIDLMRVGRLSMSASNRLRRFLDTGDLVMSVFGDLWTDLGDLRFESRNQFTALFAKRMGWKAVDQVRRLQSKRRAEDMRLHQDPEELDVGTTDAGTAPLPEAIRKEEREQLILILLRLKDRDRAILTLHLQNRSIDAIATELGLSYDAARQALNRAIERARLIAARSRQSPLGN